MDILSIQATEITPNVLLDKGRGLFIIEGKCLPEDVKSFFNPIIEWFELYLKNPNDKTTIILDFEYFNTASSKMILIILSKLRDIQKNGKEVEVTWKYPKYDVELEDAGEEFSELLNIPFKLVPKIE
jgi:hypothetical protein